MFPPTIMTLRALLGYNLVSADHETWKGLRPRTAFTITGAALAEFGEVMRAVMIEDVLPRLERASAEGEAVDVFETMLNTFGPDKVVAALDVRASESGEFFPATHGWLESSSTPLNEVLQRFVEAGLKHCLCTDIGRDGMLSGPNVGLYQSIKQQFPDLTLQASGGVADLNDLTELDAAGIDAVILGKSLLEGRFSLDQAVTGFGQGEAMA